MPADTYSSCTCMENGSDDSDLPDCTPLDKWFVDCMPTQLHGVLLASLIGPIPLSDLLPGKTAL